MAIIGVALIDIALRQAVIRGDQNVRAAVEPGADVDHLLHAVYIKLGTLTTTTTHWNHLASAPKIAASEQ